jgi:isopentenyl diphosphate isomerase/L-lactate dehydrogenase-like FMN-dependent dehydrogenase
LAAPLAAYGERGVSAVLQLIEHELAAAMALTGVEDAARVPRGVVTAPC